MVVLAWVVVLLVAVVGVAPSPARVPVRRVVLALIGFVCLVAAFLIYGFVINDEFPSARQLVVMVLSFSLSASLGYLFGAGGADLIVGSNRRALGGWGKVVLVVVTVVLGALFFLGGSYLAIHYVNPGYLNYIQL